MNTHDRAQERQPLAAALELAKRFASDLSVRQPIKFEPVLNLKTDKALGLTFLAAQIARVDEVIE